MATSKISLKALWQSATPTEEQFNPDCLSELPKPAQQYLKHAIAPGTPLASAVWLKMHGEINLKGWHPFTAEQVICAQKGMIWQTTAWMNRLPILGSDRVVNGEGSMQWKLLGLLPVETADGPDVTRSAVGRMQGEYVWLPSALLDPEVNWTGLEKSRAQVEMTFLGETTQLKLDISDTGQLKTAQFQRWGNPGESVYHYENFGVIAEEERTFAGYTIPTKLRAGWYFGNDSLSERSSQRYLTEGEFFRATIENATYR